jgi:hypothetical protein
MVQNTLQSTYNQYATAALAAGTIADEIESQCGTYIMESASCGFGLAVSQGTADNGATLGGSAFIGVAVKDITLLHTTADRYEQYDNMAVLLEGDIWVTAGSNVVVGHPVYYNSSTGAFGNSGIANAVLIGGSRWLDTASSSAGARLRLSSTAGHTATS